MVSKEFRELWENWKKQGSAEARDALLSAYVPLVQRVFSRVRIGLSKASEESLWEDLKHAGVIGLMEAFEHFSEKMGAAFSTYASHRIRGAMLDELRRQDWLSKGSRHRLKEFQKAYSEVEQRLGRSATEEEIAAHLKISAEAFRQELIEVGPATLVFLDGLAGPDGESTAKSGPDRFADIKAASPEAEAQRGELLAELTRQITLLPEQERQVLSMLVFDELGQKEIAKVLDLSASRVSQIYAKAVIRLQAGLLPLFTAP